VTESWAAYYLYKKNQWAHKPVANWFIEMWSTLLNKAYLEIDGVIPTDARLSNPIKLQRKTHPWPIMTAIDASQQPDDSTWFEFTPAQVTKLDLISENWIGVETASFGCKIDDKGRKLPSPTGDEFAQLMAIWGSAPALTGAQYAAMSSPTGFSISSLFLKYLVGSDYLAPPFELPNFEQPKSKLTLRDAGICFNVPFPPLLQKERNVDVIVVLDVSENVYDEPAQALDQASRWANKYSQKKLPPITRTPENKDYWRHSRVIDEPGCPLIVWLPVTIQNATQVAPTFTLYLDDAAHKTIQNAVLASWTKELKHELAEKIVKRSIG